MEPTLGKSLPDGCRPAPHPGWGVLQLLVFDDIADSMVMRYQEFKTAPVNKDGAIVTRSPPRLGREKQAAASPRNSLVHEAVRNNVATVKASCMPGQHNTSQHWCYQYQLCWWSWYTGGKPVELVDTSNWSTQFVAVGTSSTGVGQTWPAKTGSWKPAVRPFF